MASKVAIGGGIFAIIVLILFIYSTRTGFSIKGDPQLGDVNVPNWFIWLHRIKNPELSKLPQNVQNIQMVLAYTGKGR